MLVYRISRKKYSRRLTSSGIANRWNLDQQWVIYTSSSRSLATLELFVHSAMVQFHHSYQIMIISIDNNKDCITNISTDQLPANWQSMEAYPVLQKLGHKWYITKSSLVLQVPSVIIPQEYNYIINTHHPDFNDQIKLIKSEAFLWDKRLKFHQ